MNKGREYVCVAADLCHLAVMGAATIIGRSDPSPAGAMPKEANFFLRTEQLKWGGLQITFLLAEECNFDVNAGNCRT